MSYDCHHWAQILFKRYLYFFLNLIIKQIKIRVSIVKYFYIYFGIENLSS